MRSYQRDDRIQGVLFHARQTVFAGPALHPKALLLKTRQFAAKFTLPRRRPRVEIQKRYRVESNATDLLKRLRAS